MSEIRMIGSIDHPHHGSYYLYWDSGSGCYGISRVPNNIIHCGYASLSMLLQTKGL